MFCPNCGKEIKDKSNFCDNCGTDMKNSSDSVKENEKKGLIYCLLAYIFTFTGFGINYIVYYFFHLSHTANFFFRFSEFLIGLIFIIIANKKCPSNNKILLISLFYVLFGIALIALVVFFYSSLEVFIRTMNSCKGLH